MNLCFITHVLYLSRASSTNRLTLLLKRVLCDVLIVHAISREWRRTSTKINTGNCKFSIPCECLWFTGMNESNEKSSLLGHNLGFSSTKTTTRVQCKVYKRRWYVLFVFTAEAFIFNMTWNTWGPIQEQFKAAYGWTDFNIIVLNLWAAIAFLATTFPLTWLMDSKGLCFLSRVLLHSIYKPAIRRSFFSGWKRREKET